MGAELVRCCAAPTTCTVILIEWRDQYNYIAHNCSTQQLHTAQLIVCSSQLPRLPLFHMRRVAAYFSGLHAL